MDELQLHTVASVHVHTAALQPIWQRTVYDKLLRGICGGTYVNFVDRTGGLPHVAEAANQAITHLLIIASAFG
jgi:hypothetical protein